MCILERRLQLLIDEARYRRLARRAKETNLSVGAVVREAIDRAYPDDGGTRRRAAGRRILGASPMAVLDPGALRAELEDLRGRRG
jgi:hypothetical protein